MHVTWKQPRDVVASNTNFVIFFLGDVDGHVVIVWVLLQSWLGRTFQYYRLFKLRRSLFFFSYIEIRAPNNLRRLIDVAEWTSFPRNYDPISDFMGFTFSCPKHMGLLEESLVLWVRPMNFKTKSISNPWTSTQCIQPRLLVYKFWVATYNFGSLV